MGSPSNNLCGDLQIGLGTAVVHTTVTMNMTVYRYLRIDNASLCNFTPISRNRHPLTALDGQFKIR
jgi:hypothetical protein